VEQSRWQQHERMMGPPWTATVDSIMSVRRSYRGAKPLAATRMCDGTAADRGR